MTSLILLMMMMMMVITTSACGPQSPFLPRTFYGKHASSVVRLNLAALKLHLSFDLSPALIPEALNSTCGAVETIVPVRAPSLMRPQLFMLPKPGPQSSLFKIHQS